MECCICFDNINIEETYKYWECDCHYTCKGCGVSLQNCPLCRSHVKKNEIRKDWKEEAKRRGLCLNVSDIDDDPNKSNCIIDSWTEMGRCLISKQQAIKLNKQDIRLSW